jgi:DNA sulfur modification protein DndC
MESMLEADEKYACLRGLNNFRNYLIATQWDMSTRELVGRTISDAGYLAVRPDVYELSMRQRLLAYLLTLDELERERAESLEADIVTGKVPRTAENLRMSPP